MTNKQKNYLEAIIVALLFLVTLFFLDVPIFLYVLLGSCMLITIFFIEIWDYNGKN